MATIYTGHVIEPLVRYQNTNIYLELVQVEDVLDGWTGGECKLALLLILCLLFDDLGDCASINDTEANYLR